MGEFKKPEARAFIREKLANLRADQFACSQADERREAVVHGDDGLAVANQEAFHCGVGQSAHALGLEIVAPTVAQFLGDAGERENDDDQACASHRNREPPGRQRRGGNFNGRIGQNRGGRHRGEMMAADRRGQ